MGLKNNLQIQVATLETKKTKELTKSGWELPKTEINASFGHLNSMENDKNLEIKQQFNPFEIGARKKVLNLNNSASEINLAKAKQNLIFTIRQSWNSLLYYNSQMKLLQEQNEILLKFANAATFRYDLGETNALEKNIAVVKQMELEQNIKKNKALMDIEKNKLTQLMQIDTDFTTEEKELLALDYTTSDNSTDANLNLKEAEVQINLAKANHKLEKASLYPEFSVGYFMQSMIGAEKANNPNAFYGSDLDFAGFMVGIDIPIFAGSSISKAKAAKIQTEVEEKNSAFVKSEIKASFEQEITKLETAKSLMDFYKTVALPNVKEINNNADKSFKNGAISYVEYVESIQTAYEVRLSANEAVYKYNQNVINLHYLTNQ